MCHTWGRSVPAYRLMIPGSTSPGSYTVSFPHVELVSRAAGSLCLLL